MDARVETEPNKPAKLPYRRPHETKWSVLAKDKAADWIITVGGIFVILAVFGIMAFLIRVVVPLFTGAQLDSRTQHAYAAVDTTALAVTDEYHSVLALLQKDGVVRVSHLASGRTLKPLQVDLGGREATAFAQTLAGNHIAIGFSDGHVAFGTINLSATVLRGTDLPTGMAKLNDRDWTDGTVIYSRIPGDQIRRIEASVALDPAQRISDSAIVSIDYHLGGTAERPTRTLATIDASGEVRLSRAESRVNAMTGKVRTNVATTVLPDLPKEARFKSAITVDAGDQLYLPEANGLIWRYDTRDFKAPQLAEKVRVLPEGVELSALRFLIGEQSLVVGGTNGTIDVFFRLPRAEARSTDGFTLVRAHALEPQPTGVTAIAPSPRSKMFTTADAAGNVWLRHSTSGQTLLKLEKGTGAALYQALVMGPREDSAIAISDKGQVTTWEFRAPHPETTLSTIFGRVWYEGYDRPSLTWQSSSGTDQFEPKLSLVPLIFGTIKATVYALLFSVPIALAAAIYTSEFLHPRVRQTVKPAMEMMASLPSVVLGFIAALILAPLVETWIAAVLLLFVTIPLSFLVGGYLWQFLPGHLARRWQGLVRLGLMFAVLGLGMWLSLKLSGPFERLVFAGDLKAWANREIGSGVPFMTLILTPLAAYALTWSGVALRIGSVLTSGGRRDQGGASADLLRWVVVLACAVLVALVVSTLLAAIGFDPRGGVVDTYVQRNTLVVGMAMGFAVIPIIYTISEDALNSVPEHLRAASLACGATAWQTAVRVILPTAMSGVFAAVMIGMGRAVGETMIVVMAAGNTPILEWNIFNGLRALSANIAVELPEAVKDGTLYRMLFLAALTLFVMTFTLNTIAEVIRQRFRKRAVSL
jgi:phosphate transport system permease protein